MRQRTCFHSTQKGIHFSCVKLLILLIISADAMYLWVHSVELGFFVADYLLVCVSVTWLDMV